MDRQLRLIVYFSACIVSVYIASVLACYRPYVFEESEVKNLTLHYIGDRSDVNNHLQSKKHKISVEGSKFRKLRRLESNRGPSDSHCPVFSLQIYGANETAHDGKTGTCKAWAQTDSRTSPVVMDFNEEALHQRFSKMFPNETLTREELGTTTISTGGIRGSITLLYASLFEFLAIYHTPLPTTGTSGRHFMNISVTVMKGKVDVWKRKKATHRKGSYYMHGIGEQTIVHLHEDTWLVLHGKGFVPGTMGYWISDSLVSMDLVSAFVIVKNYLKATCKSSGICGMVETLYEVTCALLKALWEFLVKCVTDLCQYITQTCKSSGICEIAEGSLTLLWEFTLNITLNSVDNLRRYFT